MKAADVATNKRRFADLFKRNVSAAGACYHLLLNQSGLFGYRGDRDNSLFEGSPGFFLTRHIAPAFEYRQ